MGIRPWAVSGLCDIDYALSFLPHAALAQLGIDIASRGDLPFHVTILMLFAPLDAWYNEHRHRPLFFAVQQFGYLDEVLLPAPGIPTVFPTQLLSASTGSARDSALAARPVFRSSDSLLFPMKKIHMGARRIKIIVFLIATNICGLGLTGMGWR